MLAITLSIDPSAFTVTFSADDLNAGIQLVIEGNPQVNPYVEFQFVDVSGTDTVVKIPRHNKLPKGSYTIYANLMRWINCELVGVDSVSTTIHVP